MSKLKRASSITNKNKRTLQKARTHRNQVERYTKLIENNPNNKHVPDWKNKIAKLKGI